MITTHFALHSSQFLHRRCNVPDQDDPVLKVKVGVMVDYIVIIIYLVKIMITIHFALHSP